MPEVSSLRVLVTRPHPAGMKLCEKLKAAGYFPIYFPTIEILPPKNISQFQNQLSKIDQYDWIIFISPQAAKLTAKEIKAPTNMNIAAIGEGTAHALQEAGWPVNVFPKSDQRSEGLLNLTELQDVSNKKIAIIQGEGGRELIAPELTKRGAHVDSIIAYRRSLPASKLHEKFDIIVATSVEGVQNLTKLVPKNNLLSLYSVPLLVISERMKNFAEKKGFKKITVAENASDDAILKKLASKENFMSVEKK